MAAKLRVENLTVTLPSGRRILERASFEVAAGEVVVVLGPSGSGKSTLGDVIFGLLAERSPEVGVEVDAIEGDERRMALVLQRGSLFDHLDVAGNIRFAARRRRGEQLSDEAVADLLDEVGLTNRDQAVAELSGGEERRVNVARALATEPEFIFFDEPEAGLDVGNVRRLGALIRRVCTEHGAGAIVVTHNPLLAALTGDRILYLDRRDGSVIPLLGAWEKPAAPDDAYGLARLREAIEEALLDQLDAESEAEAPRAAPRSAAARVARLGRRPWQLLLTPGRLLVDLVTILMALPRSLRFAPDFGQIGWRALRMTGYSGLPFYALVAAIFSATFLSIAFAAAALVSPGVILENLRGDFILALTPALAGFLFAARSGSALTAWLGGLKLRRQTDALRSLGVSVDEYLRVPAFMGTFAAFLLTVVVFGAAMYLAGIATAAGYGLTDAAETLRQTTPSFERQLFQKTLLYGVFVGLIGTHTGLLPKRTSEDVARGITRGIIGCTLAIVLSELYFAFRL